ncbi:MAG: aminotransferase class I/II-fold pyridoxal phosphate-dependent enzyme [Lachnospiraceae bacterium]|nr:aminotransferase class I/II-fold pyridoxal phosphate-dependent enzyme [Lachnospiraceae bacterium]
MKSYLQMSKEELMECKADLEKAFEDARGKGLKLDMSRGKPAAMQLDLVMPIMDVLNSKSDLTSRDGMDCRNYGGPDGLPEAKELMAAMIDVKPEQVVVCGNSSLNIMYDTVSRSVTHGVCGSTPWCKLPEVKFLCPVPGYDRHFKVTENFGIKMINIPMTPQGPDMDLVEKYVNNDPAVKRIWCVAKYANPQGYNYSDETVRRFAALTPAAEDFRIYWDNAYCVHHLYTDPERQDHILNILDECEKAGHPDLAFEFCSTSKVSFPGAGVAAVASSANNLEWIKKSMHIQTIGHDKINQLRHVRYYKDIDGLLQQMQLHGDMMRSKFEAVEKRLEEALEGLEIGTWTKPNGGYFISFDALPGCAKAIVAKCKEAGVTLTSAGATYPYGIDPEDKNIRFAPSYPTPREMSDATEIFVLCAKLVSVDKLLEGK